MNKDSLLVCVICAIAEFDYERLLMAIDYIRSGKTPEGVSEVGFLGFVDYGLETVGKITDKLTSEDVSKEEYQEVYDCVQTIGSFLKEKTALSQKQDIAVDFNNPLNREIFELIKGLVDFFAVCWTLEESSSRR